MRFNAVLKTESKDAESVANTLQVDNMEMDDLKISTKADKGRIVTRVESNRINGLLSSLNDIMKCQMVAESVIKNS